MIPKRPSLAHYSSVSADITSDLFRNSSEEGQLDMKIGVLSKQLEQKNQKIEALREELFQLEEMKRKNIVEEVNIQEVMVDVMGLKSRMKSKK